MLPRNKAGQKDCKEQWMKGMKNSNNFFPNTLEEILSETL